MINSEIEIQVTTTLGYISRGGNWDLFCNEKGYSYYACAEGGSDMEVYLTLEECSRYDIPLPGYRLEKKWK